MKLYSLFYVISPYDGSNLLGVYSSTDKLEAAKKKYIKEYHTENGKTYGADKENFDIKEIELDAKARP